MIEVGYEKDGQQRKDYYHGIWIDSKTGRPYTIAGSLFMDWDIIEEPFEINGQMYQEVEFNLSPEYKISYVGPEY